MKHNLIILFFSFVLLSSCLGKQSEKTKLETVRPSDSITMLYSQENFYFPTLNGIINDSLKAQFLFDTGVPGKFCIAPGDLKNKIKSDNIYVQIGRLKMRMGLDFVERKNSLFRNYGSNIAIVGWEYFDNKVIELDFVHKYILVFDELPDVASYSKTKIKLSSTSHLIIPVKVVLQGKTFEDSVAIDTGNNGFGSFNTELAKKYGIDDSEAYHGKAMTNIGLFAGFSLPADSIKIGIMFVTDPKLRITFRPSTPQRPAPGLLGVKSLQQFSVILDLINYDLYLKPKNIR